MSGMAEGHDRYARGLKPRALDRGVGSLRISIPIISDSSQALSQIRRRFTLISQMVTGLSLASSWMIS